MCATGRCSLRQSVCGDFYLPLQWDDGDPWELWLRVAVADRKHYRLTGLLRCGAAEITLSEPDLLVAGGLVFCGGRAARLNDFGAFPWISLLRAREVLVFAKKEADDFMEEFLRLPRQPRLDLPDELKFDLVSARPQPSLVIKAGKRDPWGRNFVAGELSFDYDGALVTATLADRRVFQKNPRRAIQRDAQAEDAANARLKQIGFRDGVGARDAQLELPAEQVPKVARALTKEGWRVEADGKLYRSAGALKMEIRSGVDWFDLEGGAQFGDSSVSLPKLLRAIKRGENTVRLDDGSLGIIPEEWLAKYRLVASLGDADGDHLRFTRPQAGLLDALLADEPEVRVDALFERVRGELRDFTGVQAAAPSANFRGELRGYQREGLGWLEFLRRFGFGGCLADDMGLGKTIQVLALLESRRTERSREPGRTARPSLVVVPRSLVFHWKEEAARARLDLGSHRVARRKPGDHLADYDLVITTYGTLTRDALHFKNVRFDYCILDEAQAIKNAGTLSAKAARLLKADNRLALSGTPVENHLGELWSLFEFLNPGMLGGASVFGGVGRNPDVETSAILARALRPFILRRTRRAGGERLPAKTEQTIYCDLEARERKHDELRDFCRARLLKESAGNGSRTIQIQSARSLAAPAPGSLPSGFDRQTQRAEIQRQDRDAAGAVGPGAGKKITRRWCFPSLRACSRSCASGSMPRKSYAYLDGRTRDRQAK
jgi:hypothetical protein